MIELQLIKNIPVLLEKPFLEAGDRLVCFGDSLTASPQTDISTQKMEYITTAWLPN